MAQKETMDSRELGLVLGQQLLKVDDMHYGLWDDDIELKVSNIAIAQQRYTDALLQEIEQFSIGHPKVLDIGCGTGHILEQMIKKGYQADGLVPAPGFAKLVNERLAKYPESNAKLFQIPFEQFPVDEYQGFYDVALFSESFQYIPMAKSFEILRRIVRPGGRVMIWDFFKTANTGDGGVGDGTFGGGHRWEQFESMLATLPFTVLKDEDITKKMSPNLALVNDLLMNTVAPAGQTIGRYLRLNYPKCTKLVAFVFRKKLNRLKQKYFMGLRNQETFERYKTYHHIVLEVL